MPRDRGPGARSVLELDRRIEPRVHALLGGDPNRAEILAGEAYTIGTESGQPDALTIYGIQLLDVRIHQGRTGEIADLIADGAAENQGLPAMLAVAADAYVDADRLDDAHALLDQTGIDLPRNELWLVGTSIWAQVAVQLDDHDAATILYDRLLPWTGQIPTAEVAVSESVDQCLGELAAMLGRVSEADAHFAAAEATAPRSARRSISPAALIERARLDRERDPERARSRANEALAIAVEHGYARLERDATGVLALG